jgi:anti-sigma factor RsiW
MPCAESLRVEAYFDAEVDALSAVDMERHIDSCAACHALLQQLKSTRARLRRAASDIHASPALRARISAALDRETTAVGARRFKWMPASSRTRSFWAGAVGGVGASALAAACAFFLLAPLFANPLVDDLVGAHLRSLMPMHLIDVVSTDKHTVKPWFAGHTDVSPVVADFEQQGYRLIGGRADYVDQQRSAVVVYQHGAHVINVFSWAAHQRVLPNKATRNGYNLIFWRAGDLEYCAVSDTGRDELAGLVRLLQDLSARERRE